MDISKFRTVIITCKDGSVLHYERPELGCGRFQEHVNGIFGGYTSERLVQGYVDTALDYRMCESVEGRP